MRENDTAAPSFAQGKEKRATRLARPNNDPPPHTCQVSAPGREGVAQPKGDRDGRSRRPQDLAGRLVQGSRRGDD